MNNIKAILFDWGETLHDPKGGKLFEGVPELLTALSEKYVLALISLAASESTEERRKRIEDSGVANYFKVILVDDKDKDGMYEKALAVLQVKAEAVAIVDDRVVRGIAWGNRHGAMTIRVQRGKYVGEMPSNETEEPQITLKNVVELKNILL